jgi:predicted dehydrogenase
MRVLIVGYGVQGKKRLRVAGPDAAGVVDPVAPEADFRDIREVPLDRYDGALVCTPDEPKVAILNHLLAHGKHVLVEKPLHAHSEAELRALEGEARRTGAVCYTAYNHRFEPHYVRMRDLIASGELGSVYRCRMFYGNGTARLVRDSAWRDSGAGVLPDLGSHLLDTARFWFGDIGDDFRVTSVSRFENRAPDHVVVASDTSRPKLELEMTLLSWRNHFTCDILAERGSAHIESLCKWGPTTFTHRIRVLPSGRPAEHPITLTQDDPTWALEYDHFKRLCSEGKPTDLGNDIWLLRTLSRLSEQATEAAADA